VSVGHGLTDVSLAGTKLSSTRYVHYGTIDFVLSELAFELDALTAQRPPKLRAW
jgi:hypothetical protein